METVTVRWLPDHVVVVRDRLIRQGDTFEMPREEAESRTDVAIVEPVKAAPTREGR